MKSCEVAYKIMRSDTNESEFDGRTDGETSRELLFIEPIIHWAMKKCTESQSGPGCPKISGHLWLNAKTYFISLKILLIKPWTAWTIFKIWPTLERDCWQFLSNLIAVLSMKTISRMSDFLSKCEQNALKFYCTSF